MIYFKKIGVVLNGFIHDLSCGYWLSCMAAITFLHNFQANYPELYGQLKIIEQFFFWSSIGAVLLIFITGGVRTFTYVDNFYGKDAEKTRRKMLVIKHIVLLLIFGAGSFLAYKMSFY
jgi:putative copper export protein